MSLKSKLPSFVNSVKDTIFRDAIGVGASYPLDLLSSSENRAVKFSVYDYKKGKIENPEITLPLFSIYLPMPTQMIDGTVLNYDEFGGTLADIAATVKGDGSATDKTADVLGRLGAGAAIKALGNDSAIVLRELGGIQLNPRASVFFKNPQLKVYAFSYIMVARNQKESENIRTIINKLKYYASPGIVGDGTFFTHPQLFRIQFVPNDRYLFKPNDCVLTEISVSYNDQTQGAFFRDSGAPTEVSLQMTFREVEIDTKDTINTKYGSVPEQISSIVPFGTSEGE